MGNEIAGITGDILLDAGTNEFEVLIFGLRGGRYGLNVAKVREIIKPLPVSAIPGQPPTVMGMFSIRGSVIPVIDLGKHLGLGEGQPDGAGRVIITEFNGLKTGFLVDTVEHIHRVSWNTVKPPPDTGARGISAITGIVEFKESLALMIDFESVADSILIDRRLHIGEVDNPRGVDRGSKRVVLVEDSPFMRKLMHEVFVKSGYANIEVYPDGHAAWAAIENPAGARIDTIISDIEMPRMDGLHLTTRIKGAAHLKDVPVVLFSSLVSEDNLKKGKQVGADVQIPKPELMEMVRIVDRVVSGDSLKDGERFVIKGRSAA